LAVGEEGTEKVLKEDILVDWVVVGKCGLLCEACCAKVKSR